MKLVRLTLAILLMLAVPAGAVDKPSAGVSPTWPVAGLHQAKQARLASPAKVRTNARPAGRIAAADDDIPGVVLPASPVAGTLNEMSDSDDVYAVTLDAGQSITVSMTAAAGTDFDIYFYGPTSTSLATATPLGFAESMEYPERAEFHAAVSGTYYLDVWAAMGSGAYTLEYEIGQSDPDDNVPGVPLPASPCTGTLDMATDLLDVYAVDMVPGQALLATISAAPTTDFSLLIFGPTTKNVYESSPVRMSRAPNYPRGVAYSVPTTGTYYLVPVAFEGAGDYEIQWEIGAGVPDSDDDIPGVPIPASPVTGSVDEEGDWIDVFAVKLTAGQTFSASLNGPADSEFTSALWGPDATSIWLDEPLAMDFIGDGYPSKLAHEAKVSGTYYFAVAAVMGAGEYSVTYRVGAPGVSRIAGTDRYAVAAAAARKGWDSAGTKAWTGVTDVLVVNGENGREADALTAAGLAGAYGAPILLTSAAALPASTKAVITEIAAKRKAEGRSLRVHLIGGAASVPDARWAQIRAIPGVSQSKDRIWGADRYSTSAAIANRVQQVVGADKVTGIMVIAGDNPAAFYDALAAAPIAYAQKMPVVAVKRNSMPEQVMPIIYGDLEDLPCYAVSGQHYLSDFAVPLGSIRLSTSRNRSIAAAQIASSAVRRGWLAPDNVGLAAKLPDALAAGTFMGRVGGPLLMTDSTAVMAPGPELFIFDRAEQIERGWIFGGTTSVTAPVERQFRAMLQP